MNERRGTWPLRLQRGEPCLDILALVRVLDLAALVELNRPSIDHELEVVEDRLELFLGEHVLDDQEPIVEVPLYLLVIEVHPRALPSSRRRSDV